MSDILLLIAVLGGLSLISGFIFHRARNIIPYIHLGAKVSAFEAKLIPRTRLGEMAESPKTKQILTVLEDTDYQPHISEISIEEGIEPEEVEKALKSFVKGRYKELLSTVPEERKDTIEKIIGLIDVRNLKGILIGISREVSEEELEKFLIPSPTFPEERLDMLSSADSVERLLEYLKGSDYYEALSEAYEERYDEEGISALIHSLTKAYYENIWDKIEEKKSQLLVLKEIIGTKLDMMNIKLIFRLKREDVPPEKIFEYTVPTYHLTKEQIKTMTAAKDIKSINDILSGTVYAPFVQEGLNRFEETGSLFELEKALDEEFLRICRRNSVVKPFTLAPILSYIHLLETEIRNIRTIILLKSEGVRTEEIKDSLIRRREIEL